MMRKQIGFGILAVLLTMVGWVAPVFAQAKPALNPPLESQLQPKTQITLNGDRANVTLINLTNADVAYQAIGDTQVRTLPGRGTVNLQGLRVPMTLTFDRQDSGLLNITPKQSATAPNTIEVTLDATTDLGVDSPTMRVESNGSVFLY